MAASDSYQLLDFGGGRKLERFGSLVLDRPSPAAAGIRPADPQQWSQADARFVRDEQGRGAWHTASPMAHSWPIALEEFTLELKLSEAGHLGIFPEQAHNWRWIGEQVRSFTRPKVLNLFAYTGASTLAAAAAGAEVVHLDAAANVVAWARRNATNSGLEKSPIRWITEDALTFVRRELKRGNRYDAVLLDPPAYGHGPGGQAWKLTTQLDELLALCFELCGNKPRFMLLTCHSGDLAQATELGRYARDRQPGSTDLLRSNCKEMELRTAAGARLHCGAAVRWRCAEGGH